jgi:drug/metabolite transporter (DMT)-like permease
MIWWALLIIIISTFTGAYGTFLLKKASEKFQISFSQIKNYALIIGLIVYAFSWGIFIFALKFSNLSIAYPITSLTYIWTGALAYYKLKEPFSKTKIIGTILIVVGVALIGFVA